MERHLIDGNASVVEALEALNRLSGETMTLFVVGDGRRLLGSLTDGDIRRALLSGHGLSDPVSTICHSAVITDIRLARKKGIALLPVVEEGRIVSIIDLRRQRGLVPADAVLMAGGVGERLRPLTLHTPKPLLPVGGIPIIDRNIELLRSYGIGDIYVTVNYLKEQVGRHFADAAPGVDAVRIIEEPFRMGTIGSLSLIDGFRSPHVVVMNADLLTDIDLEAMYLKHVETEAWLTVAVVPYTVSVPFAIVDHEGDRVTGLSEKPTFNYYANAGIYMLRREAAREIPGDVALDATDFIDGLLKEGRRVSLYPIEGRWLDIGSPDDYRHACDLASGS